MKRKTLNILIKFGSKEIQNRKGLQQFLSQVLLVSNDFKFVSK
jgi:hypothetical protein